MPEAKLDRTHISIVSLDQGDDDRAWWLARTPEERFQGIEQQRQILYGYSEPAPEFKEFLRLLNERQIEYLLIGGYAVGYYGYVVQ